MSKTPFKTPDQWIAERIEKSSKKTYSPWYYYIDGELVKNKKPCLTGNLIHLHSWQGMYRVINASARAIYVRKNGMLQELPWTEFRCLSGMGTSIEREIKLQSRMIYNKSIESALHAQRILKLVTQ